jgi:UDP-N-acetylmuramoyl-L-alanyl-D-glutamate--2,6-diaminopimelate ligase
MRLSELFAGAALGGAGDVEVAGVTADSRKVRPGFVFAALKGVAAHGRDFVVQAKASGAAAILSEGDLEADFGLPHVVVANARAAFALAASRFYPRRPEVLVGVTGTNGKSSTVDFLRQIWAHDGKRAASLGTLGAIWGERVLDLGHTTADPVQIHQTLQMLADEGVTHAAMEVSSHGLAQHRADGLSFAAGAFTNLTQDHLDYHETMDGYRDAKLKLWALVRAGGIAAVNADSPEGDRFASAAKARGLRVVSAGWRAGDDGLKIVEILPHPASQSLILKWRGKDVKVELPLIGEFQALNAVMAGVLALNLDNDHAGVFTALGALKPIKGRMEHVGRGQSGGHVFVDYAHTPDGLDVLLRAARPHAPGRVIVVFGCGGDRDPGKRAKMGAIAKRQADVVIVTDDNPRSEDPARIRAQIVEGASGAVEIGDRGQAIREGVRMMRAGDALMIAGKGHETGQIVNGVTHPFSDQDVARAALEDQI